MQKKEVKKYLAATAKSLQSCPILCDPIDSSPSGFPRPWDSPGRNTGVGCHFLLQCTKVKNESEVAQSYSTLSDPMDCSLPGSSIHRIFQARVLESGAIAFSTNVHRNHLLKYRFHLSRVLCGGGSSALLSSQVMLRWLVPRPHFE